MSHLYSGLGNRARLVLGENRQDPPDPPRSSGDLLSFIEDAHARTAGLIQRFTPDQLDAEVEFRGQPMAGASAMMDYAHAFRHIGNILDARHLGGFETHALG